jgi:PEP-CTERM motif
MKHITRIAFLALASLAAASAQAQVINGNFGSGANGLAGWTVLGDAKVSSGVLSLTTAATVLPDATFNLSGVSAADINLLEPAAGVAAHGLNLNEQEAYEGSLVQQSFVVAAGQTLSFTWSFSTADAQFLDHAFVVFNGQVNTLASSASPGLATQSFSRTFSQAGAVKLSFGVVDTGDYEVVSRLNISNVQITPVPEAATWLMLGLGLAGLHLRSRRA